MGYPATARFVQLLYVRYPFKLMYRERLKFDIRSIFAFISNGSTQVHLIDFGYTGSIHELHTRAQQRL